MRANDIRLQIAGSLCLLLDSCAITPAVAFSEATKAHIYACIFALIISSPHSFRQDVCAC